MQSVTKSVISALAGIALQEGFIRGVDQRIEEIFPQYFTDNTDDRKKELQIKHLLTMSAGLSWEQSGPIRNQWAMSLNRHKHVINLPMEFEPGEKFIYSAGVSHLMSGILTEATGMSTLDFADQYLFRYLGIDNVRWNSDLQGCYFGNAGLFLTPRDMAKIGYLYLNHGNWEGKQIISEEWIRESTKNQMETGTDFGYGYYWWVKTIGSYECFFARGYGGQYIFVIPDLDIVTVITSSDTKDVEPDYFLEIITSYVIPSIQEP